MPKLKILITGATGFIGSNIMQYLEKQGHIVFGCGRKQAEQPNDRFFVCNLAQEILDLDLDIDVIIHAAAMTSSENTKYQELFINNCLVTMNVLSYARQQKVRRIIYMGTVSSYGEVDTVLREDSPHNNPNDYGLTKYVAEKLVRDSGIPYYTLILPGVVGKGCNNNWIMNTAQTLYNNEDLIYYNGSGAFNNILEVQDLSIFVEHLLRDESNKTATYLLGSSEKISVDNVINFLKDRFFSKSQLYCNGHGSNTFYLDVNRALSHGFSPKPIKDILEIVCKEILRRNSI